MSPFPNYPHPERFRSYDDAMKFLDTPDWSLCIPVFIEDETPHGKKVRFNPEYLNAQYEQRIDETEKQKYRAVFKR